MKKTGVSFLLLFIVLYGWAAQPEDKPTVAVLDFENNSIFNSENFQPLSKGLSQIMITEIQPVSAIQVVERSRLQTLLDELKLSQSGLLNDEASAKVGKMLGARYLILGGYMVTLNNKVRIDVRVVEVETGLTMKAGEETGKVGDVLKLVKNLSRKFLKEIQAALTKEEERSLQKGNSVKEEALLLFSKGVGLEDSGEIEKAAACYKKALEIDSKFTQAEKKLNDLEF